MLFQTGSHSISKCTAPRSAGLSFGAGVPDRRIDATELLEILAEHCSELLRLGGVGGGIRPRLSGIQHGCGHAVDLARNSQSEYGICFRFHVIELARER